MTLHIVLLVTVVLLLMLSVKLRFLVIMRGLVYMIRSIHPSAQRNVYSIAVDKPVYTILEVHSF
jgi:hypothetical protein